MLFLFAGRQAGVPRHKVVWGGRRAIGWDGMGWDGKSAPGRRESFRVLLPVRRFFEGVKRHVRGVGTCNSAVIGTWKLIDVELSQTSPLTCNIG